MLNIATFANPPYRRHLATGSLEQSARNTRGIAIATARSLDDFASAAPMMRHVATTCHAPFAPDEIDSLFGRVTTVDHGTSAGGVLLARLDDHVVGFAVLRSNTGAGLELTWLHVETGLSESVTELATQQLWDKSCEFAFNRKVPTLQIGMFVRMPQTIAADLAVEQSGNCSGS